MVFKNIIFVNNGYIESKLRIYNAIFRNSFNRRAYGNSEY